ncbi:MAG: alcohol dehydrogenase catalytic domain-containing protein [Gemmatimonadaceae bacterium]|nr:alcohol dehydrogenase catalytic domain-containing protein [Gemmatimonadaceae bacterium]
MAKMRAVQVAKAGGPLELVEKEIPTPGAGQVRVKVHACGICHSDSLTVEGHWPGINYPRVPGHEAAGVIDALGAGVLGWKAGDRVGIGWYGGSCGYCDSCRRGDFVACLINPQVSGISWDGGYAEYMVVPKEALALIPDELSFVDAGPLMCAGVTTFNSLRNSGARAGDIVAVHGIGGLGHLGVQYAARMGFHTVAIARGADKAPLAKKLGAHHYIDSTAGNAGEALAKLGGAKVIITTVTSGSAMGEVLGGLAVDGKLIALGASPEPIAVTSLQLIMARKSIAGWPSGSSIDSQDTMKFSALTGVRPMTEVMPLERAAEGYARMMSNKARFRVVLTMGNE